MDTLKRISQSGVAAALQKAERYRLLNDSSAAESICRDIIEVEPENQQALIVLLLAITDQFGDELSDGVRRARRCVALVRERVESPLETWVRLMIMFARLPEPATNVDLFDRDGQFVARLDLAYRRWRVAVEYDGAHHERNARQRQRDRERREAIEALGWRVIVITSQDLHSPQSVPWRVFHALAAHGYEGGEPVISDSWRRWFSPANL